MDPSNQLSGLLKWATGVLAGFLISRFKLSASDAAALSGGVLAVATGVWQVIHRMKVERAVKAAVELPPTASPAVVADAVKAA